MEYVALAKGIALLAIIGPGIAIGLIGYAALTAIGRNPGASKQIFTPMILALAFAELLGLLAFLSIFLIK
jgi:F-type H+-transporting ATPase subunit c